MCTVKYISEKKITINIHFFYVKLCTKTARSDSFGYQSSFTYVYAVLFSV